MYFIQKLNGLRWDKNPESKQTYYKYKGNIWFLSEY